MSSLRVIASLRADREAEKKGIRSRTSDHLMASMSTAICATTSTFHFQRKTRLTAIPPIQASKHSPPLNSTRHAYDLETQQEGKTRKETFIIYVWARGAGNFLRALTLLVLSLSMAGRTLAELASMSLRAAALASVNLSCTAARAWEAPSPCSRTHLSSSRLPAGPALHPAPPNTDIQQCHLPVRPQLSPRNNNSHQD